VAAAGLSKRPCEQAALGVAALVLGTFACIRWGGLGSGGLQRTRRRSPRDSNFCWQMRGRGCSATALVTYILWERGEEPLRARAAASQGSQAPCAAPGRRARPVTTCAMVVPACSSHLAPVTLYSLHPSHCDVMSLLSKKVLRSVHGPWGNTDGLTPFITQVHKHTAGARMSCAIGCFIMQETATLQLSTFDAVREVVTGWIEAKQYFARRSPTLHSKLMCMM